jgi:hypothetical protein
MKVTKKQLNEEIAREIRTQLREANGELWAANLLSGPQGGQVRELASRLDWDPVLIAGAVVELLEDANMHKEAEAVNKILLPTTKRVIKRS